MADFALNFPGSNQQVTAPIWEPVGNWTITTRVRPTRDDILATLIDNGGYSDGVWLYRKNNSTDIVLYAGGQNFTFSTIILPIDVWSVLTVSYDVATKTAAIDVDGGTSESQTFNYLPTFVGTLSIGANGGGGYGFEGDIDYCYFVDDTNSRTYEFNEGTGVTCADSLGGGATDGTYQSPPGADAQWVSLAVATISIDSVSPSSPYPGDTVTLTVSNASATGKTLSTTAGAVAVVTQSATEITFVCPDPITFGDLTLPFAVDIPFTVTDGAETDIANVTISVPVGVVFNQVTEKDPDGAYANDTDLQIGYSVYFEVLTGEPYFDAATGLSSVLGAATGRYTAFGTSWEPFVSVTWEAPANNAPTITSTAAISATVNVSTTHTITTNDVDGDSLTITEQGTWPSGYSLVDNSDGTATITIVATAAGSQNLVIRASDGTDYGEQTLVVTVAVAAPVFSGVIANQSGTVGDTVSLDVSGNVTGTVTSWALNSVGTNAGLSINSSGIVTGTLPSPQTVSGIVVTATNATGNDDSNAFSWVVTVATTATFSGELRSWGGEVYANRSGINVFVSSTFGGTPVHSSSLTTSTNSLGEYSVLVSGATPGTQYYVGKESSDGLITSLQKQVAT